MSRPKRKNSQPKEKVTILLDPWVHRDLKVESAKLGTTLGEIVTEALQARMVPLWKKPAPEESNE